jgi:UDP-N-acetylglucosamine--N-acetylmuramyl-(pentapeptide) pyrophosphoryl-undecaprenol N-acetylglucosamine transferase
LTVMHVVLAAGGTGGHIEPALNVGDALHRIDATVTVSVLGGDRGLEATLVPNRGYELDTVASVPMPRRPGSDLLRLGPRMSSAVRQATDVLRRRKADVVVGFGGYAAVPAYLAARRLKLPIVIHESNARAGIANRLGARLGVPLRPAISRLDRSAERESACRHFGLDPDEPTLLVFGGSQGAARLNATIRDALPALRAEGIQVLHSFGSRNDAPPEAVGYVPLPFIDRMDLAYAAADIAMTRAGAMTCSELAAVGLPGIYVPLPIGNGT